MAEISRRNLITGVLGTVGALALGAGLAGCSASGNALGPASEAVRATEAARRKAGQKVVTARLTAQPTTLDLGGLTVPTWGYGESLPGPVLRATAGDLLRIQLDNQLDTSTSVHWHGLALRNDMDGVPGITQEPIAAGAQFGYEFTAPHPGTYFYHPHSGVQLDRGLYGALIIDDPTDPGDYDQEWIVILDDWVDGTGRTPDEVLQQLLADSPGGMDGPMGGMDHGSMDESLQSPLLGGAGDVDYPHYLINGKTADAPSSLIAKPGQRVKIRMINAGSDTAFRVALGGHRLTVTHSDGFPVVPTNTDALLIAMGERYDLIVTLGDGVFPLVAAAEGKTGQALAVVRTASGATPKPDATPAELTRTVVSGLNLVASESQRLAVRQVDRQHDLTLAGNMTPYRWTINGDTFPDAKPLQVSEGERVRLRMLNKSMMFHPMHVHGHTFGLADGGARKDTVIVAPMQTVTVDLDADNPGQWATHCHNIYHAEAGMMTTLSYQS